MDKSHRYSRHCALPPTPKERVSLISQSWNCQPTPAPRSMSPISLQLRYYDDDGNEIPITSPRVRLRPSRDTTFISPRYSSRYLPQTGVEGDSKLFEFGGKPNTSDIGKHSKTNLQYCAKGHDGTFADHSMPLKTYPEGLDSSEGSPSSSAATEMLGSTLPRQRLLPRRLTYRDSPSPVIQSSSCSSYTPSWKSGTVDRYTEGLDWNGGQYLAMPSSAERGNMNSYRQTNSTCPSFSQMTCRPTRQRYSKKQAWTQFHSLGSQHEDRLHENEVRKHDQKIWPPTFAPQEDPPCVHEEGNNQSEAVNGLD